VHQLVEFEFPLLLLVVDETSGGIFWNVNSHLLKIKTN
jgi:hypothetical protein